MRRLRRRGGCGRDEQRGEMLREGREEVSEEKRRGQGRDHDGQRNLVGFVSRIDICSLVNQ